MANYTDLPNLAVGVGGLPSGTTVTVLRDNPIAIAEGAAGAPRVELPAIVNSLASIPVGSKGSHAFLGRTTSSAITAGSTYAGSTLRFASISSGSSWSGGVLSILGQSGGTPSGTWRALGSSVVSQFNATLFVRIS